MGFAEEWGLEPEDGLSLAEEAALHAPTLWTPAHVEPEGVSPLPEDFPVEDPEERTATAQVLLDFMHGQSCQRDGCDFDDVDYMAESIATIATEHLGVLQSAAVVLHVHGETLLAEQLTLALDSIAMDLLAPYLTRNGMTVEGYE